MDTRIYVMTHKRINEIPYEGYIPLQVGAEGKEDFGYLKDNFGENISGKNPSYCELTGIYWLWKNITCDTIGVVHYRRFFYENNYFLCVQRIEDLLRNYDAIIPASGFQNDENGNPLTVYDQYRKRHNARDLDICREVIIEKYPEYVKAFDVSIKDGYFINLGNMWVTSKKVFDSYCEWLFDILFEVERRTDISDYDAYQGRIYGFLSERLFRVWLLMQPMKDLEMKVEMKDIAEIKVPKKIICMTGVYDIIDIFTYQIIDRLRELGYEVMEFNTKKMTENLGKLYDFIKTPVKTVLTFNNLGFNMELIEGQNLWETLGIPVINILLDHPFCHKKALDDAPGNAIVLTIDKNHMNYVSRFYPNIPMVGFLPLAGKHLDREKKALSERKIDVIYAGGISRSFAEQMKPDWSRYDFDAEKLCEESLEKLINEPSHTTEEILEENLKKYGVNVYDDELCQLIEEFHFVDLLAVSYYREKVVKTLVENGVKVTLFGTGWECCDWLDNPNLDFRGRVSADEIVEIMHDSKIVLSTMTWFKDGAHDRVFNGMLSGAVAVTDSSKYMREEFVSSDPIDGASDDLVMFELEEIDALPDKIKFLLENPDKAQAIADRGYKKAFNHTWAARAEELDRDLLSQI